VQYYLPSLPLEKGTCLALKQCSGGHVGFCLPFRKHLRGNHASYGRKHMQNKVLFRKSIKLCDQTMHYTSSARWILHFTGKNSNFSRISWADVIQPAVQKNHRRTRTDTFSQHNYCNCKDHNQRITSNSSSHVGKSTIWIFTIPSKFIYSISLHRCCNNDYVSVRFLHITHVSNLDCPSLDESDRAVAVYRKQLIRNKDSLLPMSVT
jgi:hypothetical protein